MTKLNLNSTLNKCLFLFGAGASYGTGCLTSNGMLKALEKKLTTPNLSEMSEPQAEAFRFVISSLEYHSKWRSLDGNSQFRFEPNIEELALVIRKIKNRENFLPYPITGNWADKLINLEKQHELNNNYEEGLFESIERKLKSEFVPSWLNHDPDKLDYLDPLIKLLASENLKHPLECFSLNYDNTIEDALGNHEIKPYTGFISGEWAGMDVSEVVDEFDKIKYYKLHGSLNWIRLLQDGSVKERNRLTQEQQEDIDNEHSPYIVFGHGSKTFSFDPFFNLISNFKKKLLERDYIFAIGYSFFDPYINNLIIEALNASPYKKLIIINPSWKPGDLQENEKNEKFDLYTINNGKSVSPQLSEYIRQIQLNSFYSELPEFNLSRISGENTIHLMPIGFDKFLEKYFLNEGEDLIKLVEYYESKRVLEENPF
ncbi:SIR2 family protein [Leeuwenhoekiella palythoae]|uniref:SIR2-like domain-containing protein n=1 Tax=Leeuwenhoekiella palythoae TaxID=573501 RepID=A0A1M5ZSR8_9FLAO|nr:SIR2 family protein [Leeuwenhoekiella palythoae]SHI27262.1 SIR2-like domain-containing protein [Leeuwenhoekiella palythoae]